MAWESISERKSKRYEERLNGKVKLTHYKTFGKAIEFKSIYMGWLMQDPDCCVFKFRSGTHGLNEDLGRHRGRQSNVSCVIMSVRVSVMCCGSVQNIVAVLVNITGEAREWVRML